MIFANACDRGRVFLFAKSCVNIETSNMHKIYREIHNLKIFHVILVDKIKKGWVIL